MHSFWLFIGKILWTPLYLVLRRPSRHNIFYFAKVRRNFSFKCELQDLKCQNSSNFICQALAARYLQDSAATFPVSSCWHICRFAENCVIVGLGHLFSRGREPWSLVRLKNRGEQLTCWSVFELSMITKNDHGGKHCMATF